MHVHMLYESLQRDLLPLILLGKELQKYGVSCEIEQLRSASNRLMRKKNIPGLIIFPFCYNDSNLKTSLSRIWWRGEAAMNLCCEQFWRKTNQLLPGGTLLKEGMICVAWGERYATKLEAASVPKDQIRITGNIRLDLPFYKELLFSREFLSKQYRLDLNKPWILVPWNLQGGTEDGPTLWTRTAEKYKTTIPENLYHINKVSRDAHLQLCKRLAKEFKNHQIIIRSHPSGEEPERLKNIFGSEFPNVFLIHDLDIVNWILQSEVVLGWTSTSLLEAVAANIPALSYEPVPYFKTFEYPVGEMLPIATSEDEVIEKLQNLKELKCRNEEEFFGWYGNVDGKASVRLAEVCLEILKNVEKHAIPTKIVKSKLSFPRNILRRITQFYPQINSNISELVYGKRKKTKRWIPAKKIQEIVDAKSIENLFPWIS